MSLDERAYAGVVNFILESGFATGDRLPPERTLAARLSLSRHRVRLALARLENEGTVQRYIGRGTYVADGRRDADTEATLEIHFTNPREVMEARLALEPSVARLAAFRATAQDLERLDTCLARCNSPDDLAAFRRWDMKLHQAITRATGNALLQGVFRYIHSERDRYLWGQLGDAALEEGSGRVFKYIVQHKAIVESIRERDPDAAEHAMRDHLETVRHHLFGSY